jgi:hypothetical protein
MRVLVRGSVHLCSRNGMPAVFANEGVVVNKCLSGLNREFVLQQNQTSRFVGASLQNVSASASSNR